jgi:hypothetical protein
LTRTLVPLSRDAANAFVELHHRHCKRVAVHRGAIGCEVDGELVGVAVIGNPKARVAQQADRFLVEIVRVCVAPNAPRNTASWLYARARHAAYALGFRTVETKNLDTESGASLRAAGFQLVPRRKRRESWAGTTRARVRAALSTDFQTKGTWRSVASRPAQEGAGRG